MRDLAGWIRAVNTANGFEQPEWSNLLGKLMLVVTELDEARDAVRGRAQDPLAEELADTAIRLIDMLGSVWTDTWTYREYVGVEREMDRNPPFIFRSIEDTLWRILSYVCRAAEEWRHDDWEDVRISLEFALREVVHIGTSLGIDMRGEIERKVQRNVGRGRFHGKAKADG